MQFMRQSITVNSTVVKPSTSDIHIVHRIWIKVKQYAKMTLSSLYWVSLDYTNLSCGL